MFMAKCGLVAKKLLVNDSSVSSKYACLLGVVSNRKILTGEIFCFLEKRLLSIFKFCASSNSLFFYELVLKHGRPEYLNPKHKNPERMKNK